MPGRRPVAQEFKMPPLQPQGSKNPRILSSWDHRTRRQCYFELPYWLKHTAMIHLKSDDSDFQAQEMVR